MQLDPKLSYGHLIQLAVVTFAVVAGYFQLKADQAADRAAAALARQAIEAQIAQQRIEINSQQRLMELQLTQIGVMIADVATDFKEHQSLLRAELEILSAPLPASPPAKKQ